MAVKGILFDLYGTLIDIKTDESRKDIYRTIAHYLTYHGVYIHRWEVRNRYYEIMKQQKEERQERYPEIDVEVIWNDLLRQEGIKSKAKRRNLSRIVAQIYRGISRKRLQLYPDVQRVLNELRPAYRMAIVSDAQLCYVFPEMKAVGLEGYFDPIIISAHYGFRKPDRRLFEKALDFMCLSPAEVIYVGNDMYRDIYGAKQLGIKTIFIDSNQGEKYYENVSPDYMCHHFREVLSMIALIGPMST